MLLTSRQVAEKLGVTRSYVTVLAGKGILPSVPANRQTPSGRVNYGFDPKAVREFQKTFIPPAPKAKPAKLNGHADHPELPFDIVAVQARLDRIEAMQARLGSIEEKLDELLAVWK